MPTRQYGKNQTVMVLGATGVMGQRVVRLLHRQQPDVRVIKASHRARADTVSVDIHDAGSLDGALNDAGAVVNAVGPYDYDPEPLLRACFRWHCHYVDLAETPAFITRVEQLVRQMANDATIIHVLSGCSTVPGLVQALVMDWADRADIARICIYLGMGSANPVSTALLYSLLEPLGSRAPDGGRYYSHLIRHGHSARWYGRYPSPFDGDGIQLNGRNVAATFFAGMDYAWHAPLLWTAARVVPHLSHGVLRQLCRAVQPMMPLVRCFGGYVGVLTIEALLLNGRVAERINVRANREGLDIPALPAVWAVEGLQQVNDKPVYHLHEIYRPEELAARLRAAGYLVTRSRVESK